MNSGQDNLLTLLLRRAHSTPDAVALVDHGNATAESVAVSWAVLARRAFGIADAIASKGTPGDRVLLCLGTGSDFIAGLVACLIADRIAVPFHPPRRGRGKARFEAIMADCAPALSLVAADRCDLAGELAPGPLWLAIDGLVAETLPEAAPPLTAGIAYLQYTSGSTSAPRGVCISPANLLANARDIARRVPHDAGSVMVSWLPLYHDMGLVFGAFYPLVAGFPAHLVEPAAFLQEPLRWPRLMAQLKATHSGAPTFGYRLTAERAEAAHLDDLDLSAWSVAMCGAEPIHKPALDLFAKAFAAAGFRSDAFGVGYGLAEATLMVTAGSGGLATLVSEGAQTSEQVAVGSAPEGTCVRVVDPETGQLVADGTVGEIWVSGPGIAGGYWNRPEDSAATFANTIAGEDGGFLRTGDLGLLRGGVLAVTGRIKDLIIVRGGNQHPHDIERIGEAAHGDLRPHGAVAFATHVDGREALAILLEVRRSALRRLEADAVLRAVRVAVTDETGISPDLVLLLRPGSVPVTPSGKPQRRQAARMLAEGQFSPLAQWSGEVAGDPAVDGPPPAGRLALQDWLRARCAARLVLVPGDIDLREPLHRYGFDSLAAVSLAGDLERLLGRAVSPTTAYDYPSIAELARYLSGEADGAVAAGPVARQEPIAIVGMAVRLPGAPDLAGFERLLYSDVDAVRELPPGRWGAEAARLVEGLEEPARAIPITRGGWLDDVAGFDERFFGISAREASFIDPQQRLLLEVAWEALEDAGIPADHLTGQEVGLCIGISDCDYRRRAGAAAAIDPYIGTGSALSIAANRLSYFFDWRGPSLAIDTACSSSLVAVHEAAEMLRGQRVPLALAGGVNLILSPETSVAFARGGMLSPDGLCKTFDADADGYVRGEGCGVVVLKRLADALRDGDRIHAVLLGSAINQDGRSNGLTAPNGPAQREVMRRALAASGCAAGEIGFIEAHGTGTALGDPIEFGALDAVYGAKGDGPPCPLGALKSRIGHLEAAAGIAGLIKAAIALERGTIPANLHFNAANPRLALANSRLRPAAAEAPFAGEVRRAAVSAFGFGGTNAHAILGSGPSLKTPASGDAAGVLLFSAHDDAACKALARHHAGAIRALDAPAFAAYGRASALGRAHLPHRAALAASNGAEAAAKLDAWLAGKTDSGVHAASRMITAISPPRIGFLFTGQGALAAGSGKELLAREPVFRAAFVRAATAARKHGIALVPALGSDTLLRQPAVVQPAQFAFAYALARLWQSWGVVPHAVLGHSLGEYAAACLAGVMEVEDAVDALIARGRLAEQLAPPGAMLAVKADAGELAGTFAGALDGLAVEFAVDNGPQAIVLAGAPDQIGLAQGRIEAIGIKCTELAITHAFHHRAMAPVAEGMARQLAGVALAVPQLPYVSSMTGALADTALAEPTYWAEQIVRPVNFAAGMAVLAEQGCDLFLEIGAAPVLTWLGRAILPGRNVGDWIESLRPGEPERQVLAEAAGRLHVAGVAIDWDVALVGAGPAPVPLPTYPFQHRRHWLPDEQPQMPARARSNGKERIGGLERIATASSREAIFAARLDPRVDAYLADHRVAGALWAPAATMLHLVVAARQSLATGPIAIEAIRLLAPLTLDETAPREVQVVAALDAGGDIQLLSRGDDGQWQVHLAARAMAQQPGFAPADMARARSDCAEAVSPGAVYETLGKAGLDYGPGLRKLLTIQRGKGELLVQVGHGTVGAGALLDPVMIDACLQGLAALLPDTGATVLVPASIERLVIDRAIPVGPAWCHARMRASPAGSPVFDLAISDTDTDTGLPAIRIDGLMLRAVAPAHAQGDGTAASLLHRMQWLSAPLIPNGAVALAPLAAKLADRLAAPAHGQDLATWARTSAALERASGIVAAQALIGLAGPGAALLPAPGALMVQAGIAPCHARLLARVYEIAEAAGLLRPVATGWQLADAIPEAFGDLASDIAATPEFALLKTCASHVADVLRGSVDPLAVLFGGTDGGATAALYRHAAGLRVMNTLAADALRAFAGSRPEDRPLALLEIGAGTGATTAHLLDALTGRAIDYAFTDVSAVFLAEARECFAAIAGLHPALLDIERDPLEQGFAPAQRDCVVAANILHATRDLAATLAHVRSLLAPGGLLLIVEGTAPSGFTDLTFGLTEGWWRFADTALRPDHPLLDCEGWVALLDGAGFEEPHVISPRGPDGALLGQSLVVARAPMRARKDHWLLLADNGGTAAALARAMAPHGAVTLLAPGADATALCNATVVADLRGLDAPTADGLADGARALATGLALGSDFAALIGALAHGPRPSPRLVLVTRGAEAAGDHGGMPGLAQSMLRGMGRVAALEHPELRPLRIDLDPLAAPDDVAMLAAELAQGDDREEEIAFRQGRRLAGRIVALDLVPPMALAEQAATVRQVLAVDTPGDLGTLCYFTRPRPDLAPDAIEIAVEATALHFRDLLTALDRAGCEADAAALGTECAGSVTRTGSAVTDFAIGDRVLAFADGACSDHVVVLARRAVRCPDGLAPARAVDCGAYVTVERAIAAAGGIRAGSRVLVHAGAGATGLAAIAIAHQRGASTMATASPWKHPALKRRGVAAVFHSRNSGFAEGVRAAAGGQGVDMVLNSLTGEAITAGLRCLSPGGHFVELGMAELLSPEAVAAIRPDVRYHALNLVADLLREPECIRAIIADVLGRLADGSLPGLPQTSFPADQVDEAFRQMQAASQIGRIVIDHRRRTPMGAPIASQGTYLVTGGLGGIGLALAEWLTRRGARSIVLAGRSAPGDDARRVIAQCAAAGAQVRAVRLDVADGAELGALLDEIAVGSQPLRGVFHAAGLLEDATLLNLTPAGMEAVLRPKVAGAMELHRRTQELALDYFVLFSSAAALFGAPGQAAHAAANAFMDALAVYRRSCGLPAHSIQWGAWARIGAAARKGASAPSHLPGLRQMAPEDALAALDTLLLRPGSVSAALAVDWLALDAAIGPRPLLRDVVQRPAETPFAARAQQLAAPTIAALVDAPPGEARALLAAFVTAIVSRVLSVPPGLDVRQDQGFFDMGMDSLTSLELRNTLQRAFERPMPSMLTFDHPTVEALSGWLAEELLGTATAEDAVPEPEARDVDEEVEQLQRELARELETLSGEWSQ